MTEQIWLIDELAALNRYACLLLNLDYPLEGYSDNEFKNGVENAACMLKKDWGAAVLSALPDFILKRYLALHLKGICILSDTLNSKITSPNDYFPNKLAPLLQDALLGLIEHQQNYYSSFFNNAECPPVISSSRMWAIIISKLETLEGLVIESPINGWLRQCLQDCFNQIRSHENGVDLTYRVYAYLEQLISGLHQILITHHSEVLDNIISDFFMTCNYNHLSYFNFRKKVISKQLEDLDFYEQLEFLNEQHNLLIMCQLPARFDIQWPDINLMVAAFIEQKIEKIKEGIKHDQIPTANDSLKLFLNLSVAELACLIRLFLDERKFNSQNLTAIFKFAVTHFSSKKQGNISMGSLSKEYYSVSQKTAAVVKDLLSKMVLRINKTYFPIMAVISVALLVYS